MHNWLKIILLTLVTSCSLNSLAQEPIDTVYFYDSWKQILNNIPEKMVVSPVIEDINPFEIDIYTTSNDYSLYNHVAASLGDNIWLVSGKYIRNNFKGDLRELSSAKYYPLFFNEKVAYLLSLTINENQSLKDILFGTTDDYDLVVCFYYLDFRNRSVRKVTSKVMSELLEDYHDLQMRFEGMKNNKRNEIIEDYFYKFVDRATDDIMRPYILDLVSD